MVPLVWILLASSVGHALTLVETGAKSPFPESDYLCVAAGPNQPSSAVRIELRGYHLIQGMVHHKKGVVHSVSGILTPPHVFDSGAYKARELTPTPERPKVDYFADQPHRPWKTMDRLAVLDLESEYIEKVQYMESHSDYNLEVGLPVITKVEIVQRDDSSSKPWEVRVTTEDFTPEQRKAIIENRNRLMREEVPQRKGDIAARQQRPGDEAAAIKKAGEFAAPKAGQNLTHENVTTFEATVENEQIKKLSYRSTEGVVHVEKDFSKHRKVAVVQRRLAEIAKLAACCADDSKPHCVRKFRPATVVQSATYKGLPSKPSVSPGPVARPAATSR